MAAPSLRALGTVVATTTANPSFDEPAGTASTDIVVVGMFLNPTVTVTGTPTGFASLADLPQNNGGGADPSHQLAGYWARRSDAGAGPYVFTLSSSIFVEGRAAAIQDAITTGDPWEAADGNTSGLTSVTTAPSVSATSAGTDRLAWYMASNWAGGAWTPPSGYTEDWDANDRIVTMDHLTLATAQTTTPQAVCASSSRSNAWVGILLPVASAATATPGAQVAPVAAVVRASSW